MKITITILLIFIFFEIANACKLPNQKVNLFVVTQEKYERYENLIKRGLKQKGFNVLYDYNKSALQLKFSELETKGFIGYSYEASFKVIDKVNQIFISDKVVLETGSTPNNWAIRKYDPIFVKKVVDKIHKNILYDKCDKFQLFFDKRIALEKQQSFKYSQQQAVESAKEQKRIIALAKLSQEKNYTKLKKVLKIKPEYINLMDAKTQTMLIGYYCLGEIAKALQSGMSDEQMIKELEKSNSTYISYFSLEQKDYLREEGLSSRLIEFLELHTQEMNLKREQKRRIAKMERKIEREEAETREAIEQDRQRERTRRERQAKNNADAQRWKDMSNALTKTTNEMMSNIQHRSNQQHYANDAYNDAISPKKRTTNYNNSYRSEQREINNNYNTKLANIKAKKMQLKNQQSNLNTCYEIVGSWYISEGKISSGFTDKQFFSEKSVGAMVYSKRGKKAIINNFSSKSYTVTFPDKIIHKEFVYVIGKVKQNAACYGNNSINGQYTNIRLLRLAVDSNSNLKDTHVDGGNSISQ